MGSQRSYKKRIHKIICRPKRESTEKEITEATLKRLHTLGNQKFATSPFSDHFNRWLTNVTIVLDEFESHPNINLDEKYIRERTETLTDIEKQLKERRLKETALDQETRSIVFYKNCLAQINTEYLSAVEKSKAEKNLKIKRLYRIINQMKREQNRVIKAKTGFLRGFSKKDREHKEIEIAQKLYEKQTELEVVILELKAKQRQLEEESEKRKEPVVEQIKDLQKKIKNSETDGSLEDRWFACETLIDIVNAFLQRKNS